MNVMQVCSMAFTILVHEKNLMIRVETNNVVLRVEPGRKTCTNMVAKHDRITNMQVSHWCERGFRATGMGHAYV